MSRIIEWQAPPLTPAQITTKRRYDNARALADELSRRPDEWALIGRGVRITEEYLKEHLGALWPQGVRWHLDGRPYGHDTLEWVNGKSGDCVADVYAQYSTVFAELHGVAR